MSAPQVAFRTAAALLMGRDLRLALRRAGDSLLPLGFFLVITTLFPLALDPALLFLDEPTSGLDPIAAAEFDRLVRDLKESLGLTVFLVTHDLDSLIAIADRIAVLIDKRLRIGTMAELLEDSNPWIMAYFRGPRGRAALAAAPAAGNG